ncbi:hypothetical protein [Hymenobacter sp. YC55]|uniref:hypothetical protein n=1 Tax=Hymenobacter sp. YC55 TaxID=3034019 RepID=UPI0023F8951D|nr:hypothetical protein [Hymenobacter sp. YC55]MDF7810505.1 hypothetical protein [Hymenobacter sp. YC55]
MLDAFVSSDLSFGYLSGIGAVVRTGAGAGQEAGTASTTSVKKDQGGNAEVAFWGDDNLFPQNVVADAESNTSLATMLNWKAKAWYGGGLVYGTLDFDDQGEEVFKRVRNTEIDAFLNRTLINRYAMEALLDVSWFSNGFPELILSRNRAKIVGISEQECCDTRYAKAKGPLDFKRKVFINANWANGGRWDDEYTTTVPVLDPYYDAVEALRERTDGFKYIYPISFPSPDKTEYQLASWNSVRRSGWLGIGKAVVEFKAKLLGQILSIEWLIEIHPAYWQWKYKDWEDKTEDEQRRLMKVELKNFGEVMSGSNGAGKALMTTMVKDAQGNDVPAFKVTPLDKASKEGFLNEDSQESASHVFTAGGVAPTLMGIQPGKNMGAGSGSDARVAFNNFISTSTFEQDLVLEPLHFIRDFNGWPANIHFRFKQPLIMTMDKGKQVQQQTS